MRDDLSVEEVRRLFTYNPDEPFLRWRHSAGRHGRIPAGSPSGGTAGSVEGYRTVSIHGKLYRSSRLIWVYVTGKWPDHQIDHKDNDTGNDRWENLREATGSQNKANCRKYKRNKASCPLKGVQAVQKRHSIRYRAVATKDGVRRNLGNFDTPEEAHAAYLKASAELHGEFSNDGKLKNG